MSAEKKRDKDEQNRRRKREKREREDEKEKALDDEPRAMTEQPWSEQFTIYLIYYLLSLKFIARLFSGQ